MHKLSDWLYPTPLHSALYCSTAQSCLTLCDPMNCSRPGFPVLRHLLELEQTHVPRVGNAIQPSRPLSSPSPLALNPSRHQGQHIHRERCEPPARSRKAWIRSVSAQPGPGTQEVLGSNYPPCLTPTRSGEQAGGFASLRGLPAAGRGRGRPAAPPPSHHVTSKGRPGLGMRRPQRRPRRGRRAAAEGGKRQGPPPRLGGLAGWGWGAGGALFSPQRARRGTEARR